MPSLARRRRDSPAAMGVGPILGRLLLNLRPMGLGHGLSRRPGCVTAGLSSRCARLLPRRQQTHLWLMITLLLIQGALALASRPCRSRSSQLMSSRLRMLGPPRLILQGMLHADNTFTSSSMTVMSMLRAYKKRAVVLDVGRLLASLLGGLAHTRASTAVRSGFGQGLSHQRLP